MSIIKDIEAHPAYIRQLRRAGGMAVQAKHDEQPSVDAGLFDYPVWAADKEYSAGDLFMYDSKPGYVRQAHTSQANWIPFSAGTESLYGARPRQGPDGIYPYVYNMRVEGGMKVRSGKDGAVYTAIQAADPLLYDPADVPALFSKVVNTKTRRKNHEKSPS